MPSSTVFLATLLGAILGILLEGAIGGLLGGMGSFLMLRLQQLAARINVLETKLANTQDPTSNDSP